MRTRGSAKSTVVRNTKKEEPVDPVIKHLKEFYVSIPDEKKNSVGSEIIEQIALEGLNGIPFARLLKILDCMYPTLKSSSVRQARDYIWTVIVRRLLKAPDGSNVQVFYVKPGSKKNDECKLESAKYRSNLLITERPVKLPPETMARHSKADACLYPVQDGRIMGSCPYYRTREDVTKAVVDKFEEIGSDRCLTHLDKEYKLQNLYLVANQNLRLRAILPNWADPNIDIKLREYCTLELIGKSRTFGSVFPNDKAFGRYRIMLMGKGLITQYQQIANTPIEHHLKRYSHLLKDNLLTANQSTRGFKEGTRQKSSGDDVQRLSEQPVKEVCLDPCRLRVGRDILSMIYDVIARSRAGRSQIDLRRKLRLPKFHVRNHIKNLVSIRMIGSRPGNNADKDNSERMYRAAYKTKLRRMRLIVTDKPKGIMAKWDAADIRAKKMLGYRRSNFTKAEDSLLILCRIASILINPDNRLSWCVRKHVIRDILHGEFAQSRDKTSDACLRRIKYLKRLPNNIMSINELTAELRDDPDIIRFTDQPMKTDKELNRAFNLVLRTVRSKIPCLLGIQSSVTPILPKVVGGGVDSSNHKIRIKNHEDLMANYELMDCESVAKRRRRVGALAPARAISRLNPNVLILLNRHQSGSLMQLARAISSKLVARRETLAADEATNSWNDLSPRGELRSSFELFESDDLASIALLASLCSMSLWKLDLELKFLTHLDGLGWHQPNPSKWTWSGQPSASVDVSILREQISQIDASSDPSRLWKQPDGRVHLRHLSKLIESILSWLIVYPGVELNLLRSEFGRLMPYEHLLELLDLMERLELISSSRCEDREESERVRAAEMRPKPKLFGWSEASESVSHDSGSSDSPTPNGYDSYTTFQATPSGYVKFCYLIGVYLEPEPQPEEADGFASSDRKSADSAALIEEMEIG